MGTIYKNSLLVLFCFVLSGLSRAQCGALVANGSSSNMFTHIRNSTNPVAADKVLNSIVFIHRNNATAFGGNSGQLRYDVSFNAGATWTLNQGVLNPLTTNLGRYPNVAIYSPTANTNPANAYLGYMAATINATTSAWNGCVSGVRQLSGSGNTENYNQPVVNPQLIAHSLVKGAPGIFWAVDALYNGTNITGFTIYKGTWNSSSSDIVWANNFSVTPSFNTGLSSTGAVGDYNIAFDPTGTFGWFSFLGHLTPGPTNYAYYPVFYKTVNGGNTWTGPYQVDLNTFSCMTGNLAGTNVITTNFEHDLAVDVNGNPHLLTTVCNGNNGYSVIYTNWHHMYDITMKNGLWMAYDVSNVLAGRGTWGTTPNTIVQDMAPQVARSADGTKLFFTWTDNSTYSLGQANQLPNLFGKGYNVTTNTWTQVKDFSSCNSSITGSVIVPHVAPEVLEPSSNVFKLAPVYGAFTSNNDPALTSNFNFMDNVTFSSTEFTVSQVFTPTISIAQGTNVLLCPNSTISINLSGNVGQAIWSNGATGTLIPISSPTITTYSVIAQQGCGIGTASITVTNMSVSASGPSLALCAGSPATLNVSGNAISYTWNPGNITGTSAAVIASTTPVYTVTASSNANCVITNTVGLTILSLPTVSIAGSTSVCLGSVLSLTASGASTYLWDAGPNTAVANLTPTSNITYTVTGTDANNCTDDETINIVVLGLPTVTAISDKSATCVGGVISLSAAGAITFSWSNGNLTSNTTVTPAITTVYSVTGYDANLCADTKTLNVIVYPLPNILVSCNRPTVCVGEKAILTATGAATYFWSNTATTSTVQIAPTTTTTLNYTVTGTSSFSCINTATYSQLVSACTGLSEKHKDAVYISIYPNPNNGDFIIQSSVVMHVVLFNELGQVVMEAQLDNQNGNKLKVDALASGVYYVTARSADAFIKHKLVVTR